MDNLHLLSEGDRAKERLERKKERKKARDFEGE